MNKVDANAIPEICIVGGAGHVGLPLGIAFAHCGVKTLIYDINETTLEAIGRGVVPFMEVGAEPLLKEALESGMLVLSADPGEIAPVPIKVITIGTPVDEFLNPVQHIVKDCIDALLPFISDGQLLVLRSTVYPGTTNWLERYLLGKGRSILIAFCPERVVQGRGIEELQQFPQIVSGTTSRAEKLAGELFERVAPEVVVLSPMEAEFAKLFSNAYRYIQFAAANQFSMICNRAGLDYHRILAGMKKNYPRARDIPRAGFAAGPCLFKDTMQLAAFADNQFTLGHTAMMVNEGMVLYLLDEIAVKYPLEYMTVGLLGMAFKPDNDDIRSSLSYKMKKALAFRTKRVLTTDPHVTVDPGLLPLDEVIEQSDLLVLCVPHSAYRHLNLKGKPVVDISGFLSNGELAA